MHVSEQDHIAQTTPRAERIAQLNDKLRKYGVGGQIVVTRGVRQLSGYDTAALLQALRDHNEFDVDNDPHGERDFGGLDLFGAELLWKIDYYDLQLTWASPDPADPTVTIRVLTVLLAEEY